MGNHRALKFHYPNLFNIVRQKNATIADVLGSNPLNVSFKRALMGNLNVGMDINLNLVASVMHINLNVGMDTFVWAQGQIQVGQGGLQPPLGHKYKEQVSPSRLQLSPKAPSKPNSKSLSVI